MDSAELWLLTAGLVGFVGFAATGVWMLTGLQ